MGARHVRLATRGSPLARTQADGVARRLAEVAGSTPELVIVRTAGDEARDVPIDRIGGQGAFVKEVQRSVLEGRADLAVHSAKDLPAQTPPGLVLASVPERADPRDALVGSSLAGLPSGACVATGSARRRAQLAWLRPDLTFTELRGNMRTRIDKSRSVGAGVVSFAALERLGLQGEADDVLDPRDMLPQVGQGALAVECRADDDELLAWLDAVDDPGAHRALDAERSFLAALGGGCTLPLGALARFDDDDGTLRLDAILASADGHVLLRDSAQGRDAGALGASLAARLLDDLGGRALVELVP